MNDERGLRLTRRRTTVDCVAVSIDWRRRSCGVDWQLSRRSKACRLFVLIARACCARNNRIVCRVRWRQSRTGSVHRMTCSESQFAHLANNCRRIVSLFPFRFGKVLSQLFRHRTVYVVIASRVATDPRMTECLSTSESLFRIHTNQMANEILRWIWNLVPIRRIKLEISFQDLSKQICVVFVVKRWITTQENVSNNTCGWLKKTNRNDEDDSLKVKRNANIVYQCSKRRLAFRTVFEPTLPVQRSQVFHKQFALWPQFLPI